MILIYTTIYIYTYTIFYMKLWYIVCAFGAFTDDWRCLRIRCMCQCAAIANKPGLPLQFLSKVLHMQSVLIEAQIITSSIRTLQSHFNNICIIFYCLQIGLHIVWFHNHKWASLAFHHLLHNISILLCGYVLYGFG